MEPDPAELAEAKKEALRIARLIATDFKKRLEADDNATQTQIEDLVMRIYRISALIDPDMLPGMVDDDSISSGEALKIDRALGETKFRDSIRTEVLGNLINDTGTLEEVSDDTVRSYNGNYTFIHTVVKCKRKKKADNTYDKHKASTAARGDEYLRKLLQRGKQPPPRSALLSTHSHSSTSCKLPQRRIWYGQHKTSKVPTLTPLSRTMTSPLSLNWTTALPTYAASPGDNFIESGRVYTVYHSRADYGINSIVRSSFAKVISSPSSTPACSLA